MNRLKRILKYLWLFTVLRLTWFFPDWVFVMRIRGFLLKPAFKRVGRNFQVASSSMIIGSYNVSVGDNVYFAHDTWLQGVGGISIDDDVMLGPQSVVVTTNHVMHNGSFRHKPSVTAPISIGRGSWTGAGVKITSGVNIGAGVLCSAGAVVTKDVPELTIVGGVPAKPIATMNEADGSIKAKINS